MREKTLPGHYTKHYQGITQNITRALHKTLSGHYTKHYQGITQNIIRALHKTLSGHYTKHYQGNTQNIIITQNIKTLHKTSKHHQGITQNIIRALHKLKGSYNRILLFSSGTTLVTTQSNDWNQHGPCNDRSVDHYYNGKTSLRVTMETHQLLLTRIINFNNLFKKFYSSKQALANRLKKEIHHDHEYQCGYEFTITI